ncbi:MAG: response regulator transcription factor [Phycisphaerae bacterium]
MAERVVFIVDDDEAMRTAFVDLLETVQLPTESYDTAERFLEQFAPDRRGCLLLDIRMPGMGGIELHKRLIARQVTLPVIIISGHGDIPMAVEAVRRGALDFIEKPFRSQPLLDRVQQALTLDDELRRERREREAAAENFSRLTPRERDVVDRAVGGLTNKQIAVALGVSPQAIDVHRSKAMEKLHVANIPDLVRLSIKAQSN